MHGEVVTEEELTAHTREWIAGYKVPKTIEFRSEPLPLSGAMKVVKRELRAPTGPTGSAPSTELVGEAVSQIRTYPSGKAK